MKFNKLGLGDLVDVEGNVYGIYIISEDGMVCFIFNEWIMFESDIYGDFFLDIYLNDLDGWGLGDWVIDIFI